MKRISPLVIAFGVVYLFFIQTAGTLVESIYILDLMNTSLDEKPWGWCSSSLRCCCSCFSKSSQAGGSGCSSVCC